jgi:predicted regulator of Ras-like GTPase activity (Roadblock/LC7/MglB family)
MSELIGVLYAIQIELGSDFVAACIIAPGGEILEKLSEIPSRPVKLSKAHLSAGLNLLDGLQTSLNAGPVEEILVTVAHGYILITSLIGNSGYLIVAMRRKEAVDLAKLLAKEFAGELASLIISE